MSKRADKREAKIDGAERLTEQQKAHVKQRDADMRKVLNTPHGRRVLARLVAIGSGGDGLSIWDRVPETNARVYVKEGMRAVFLAQLSMVTNISPEAGTAILLSQFLNESEETQITAGAKEALAKLIEQETTHG